MPLELLPQYREVEVELVKMRGGKPLKPGSKANASHFYRVDGSTELLPSVTTTEKIIDKPGLVGWARNQTRDAMADEFLMAPPSEEDTQSEETWDTYVSKRVKAGWDAMWERSRKPKDKGVSAHEIIASILSDVINDRAALPLDVTRRLLIVERHPYEANAVLAALDFMESEKLTPLEVEYLVWHPQLRFGGTVDLIAEKENGILIVVDWKRTKALYVENDFQIAAYASSVRFLTGAEFVESLVVRLPQEEEPMGQPAEPRWVDEDALALITHVSAQALWENVNEYKARTGRK